MTPRACPDVQRNGIDGHAGTAYGRWIGNVQIIEQWSIDSRSTIIDAIAVDRRRSTSIDIDRGRSRSIDVDRCRSTSIDVHRRSIDVIIDVSSTIVGQLVVDRHLLAQNLLDVLPTGMLLADQTIILIYILLHTLDVTNGGL